MLLIFRMSWATAFYHGVLPKPERLIERSVCVGVTTGGIG